MNDVTQQARRTILLTLLAESIVTDDMLYRESKLSPVIYAYRAIISELCRKEIIHPLGKSWILTNRLKAENVPEAQS